ncbi:MAG: flavodoxin family protein [Bacteroidales bacterium]|jgi:multimeric flavodoxin WrbA|nr:flavodoxin family protein [Bacteroidales bacterium]
MHVLLVNGSPHAKGCTYTALSEIAGILKEEGIESTIFHIGTDPVHPCIGCRKCKELGKCVFDNDIANDLLDAMLNADGVIIGSPVYFAGPAGALCTILDRVFSAGSSRFALKPAAAIASCRRGGLETTMDRLNKYFTVSQMPVVPSTYWNGIHGNTPEEVFQDKEGMQVMRMLGHNMAWMLKSFSANPDRPDGEKKVKTNFVR